MASQSDPILSGDQADFELLEQYLDGELPPLELAGVERRLRAEPELSDALGRMSAEYAVRLAAWRSLAPGDAESDALSQRTIAAARRIDARARRRWVGRLSRLAGAAAACVAVGFMAGWIGRGNAASARTDLSAAAASTTRPTSRPAAPAHPPGADEASEASPGYSYQVALTDEAGNITAVQKFNNLEEAREFAAEVGRWQARQQQLEQQRPAARSSDL